MKLFISKDYTRERFITEFNGFVVNERKMPSTYEIVKWRNTCHKNISVYALDSQFSTFERVRTKDHHCYPILNMSIIKAVAKGCSLLSNIQDLEFSVHHPEDTKT